MKTDTVDAESTAGTRDGIETYRWLHAGSVIGSGAILTYNQFLRGTHDVTLEVVDRGGLTSTDTVTVEIVDSFPPSCDIAYPSNESCFGGNQTPVFVGGAAYDTCTSPSELEVVWNPPTATNGFSAHGSYAIQLDVNDEANLTCHDSIEFVIDRVPPTLTLASRMQPWIFPLVRPFESLFTASDSDGVTGDVVLERVLFNGCEIYNGATVGDGDGLLRDEVGPPTEDELCRIKHLCGGTSWTNPTLTVEVRDCAGNTIAKTGTANGSFQIVPPNRCP